MYTFLVSISVSRLCAISLAKNESTKYRLRQDSQLLQSRAINWSSQDFQTQNLNGSTNSISSSTGNINNECSESNSSTETLKWLGSMSDVSVASQATNTSTLSGIVHINQLICH
jgi:protein Shroom